MVCKNYQRWGLEPHKLRQGAAYTLLASTVGIPHSDSEEKRAYRDRNL